MDRNIAIITSFDSHGYAGGGGELLDLSRTGAYLYDHGYHSVGAIITYRYQDPHWAVDHEEIDNQFTGRVVEDVIEFNDYDAEVNFRHEDLPQSLQNQNIEGQVISFSIEYNTEENIAFAKNIEKVG